MMVDVSKSGHKSFIQRVNASPESCSNACMESGPTEQPVLHSLALTQEWADGRRGTVLLLQYESWNQGSVANVSAHLQIELLFAMACSVLSCLLKLAVSSTFSCSALRCRSVLLFFGSVPCWSLLVSIGPSVIPPCTCFLFSFM